MTIHFHGSPIWGDEHAPTDMLIKALYRDSGAFVSFARPEQMKKIAMFLVIYALITALLATG